MSLFVVVILGIVEGLTEFLPISSTGHLVLVSHWLGYSDSKAKTFDIFIQLGAVLAVAWEYRVPLVGLFVRAPSNRAARDFLVKLFLAFLPAAGVGFLFHKHIEEHLLSPIPVATAFIIGGVLMFLVELFATKKPPETVETFTWTQAVGVGVFQILGLWPGISRAGATIIGGLVLGRDRSSATQFSFYLALPTLGAATLYKLYKGRGDLTRDDIVPFGLGLVVSFIVALIVIRALLRYVRSHDFKLFAVYRVIVGIAVLFVPASAFHGGTPKTETSSDRSALLSTRWELATGEVLAEDQFIEFAWREIRESARFTSQPQPALGGRGLAELPPDEVQIPDRPGLIGRERVRGH